MIGKYTKRKIIHCNLIGLYTASAFNPGAAIVLHAPRSCSHIIAGALPAMRERYLKSGRFLSYEQDNLYVTGLSDNEAIFGGEKKLEECLRDIAEVRRPSYIMVAGGCVAGVIGDDIGSVCKKVEAETGIPILHTEGSGFMNDEENDPYIVTTKLLIEKFSPLKRSEERDKTVVILGELAVNNNRFVTECIHKLFAYFGFTNVLFPLAGMEISDFYLLNRASLAIAGKGQLNKKREIHAYTRFFAEKLGIPYNLDELPETPAEVYAYLKHTGGLLGKPALAGKAVEQEKALMQSVIEECKPVFRNKTCIVSFIFSYAYAKPERLIELIESAGLQISGFVFMPEMPDVERKKYLEALGKYEKPVFTEAEYLNRETSEDFVITAVEKPYFAKQFIMTKRHIGAKGICDFWKQVKIFLELDRRMFYEE